MNLYDLFLQCLTIKYSKAGISANYAVKREKEVLYIFFQDSEGINDWRINFDFPAKAYKRMGKTIWFAHRGFLNEWKILEPIFADIIADKSIKKVVITGYSHGGAIAMLCHEYVWYNRPDLRNVIEGYGFGAPRVFWGMKTPSLKRRWARFLVIRNLDDIVTHLPPMYFGFSHVGKLLEVGEKDKYTKIEAHLAKNILKELKNEKNYNLKGNVNKLKVKKGNLTIFQSNDKLKHIIKKEIL